MGATEQGEVEDVAQQAVGSVAQQVEEAVSAALRQVRPELAGADPLVRRSDRADFQSNVALASAKRAKVRPAELAGALADALHDASIADVAVSGPGFLNITTTDDALWRQLGLRLRGDRLGVDVPEQGSRVVVDYSAPNIAKEMHVGHLRTTIIGDCLARVLGHLGATVIRQNHLGDWGTQFGMLIQYLDEHPDARWRHDRGRARARPPSPRSTTCTAPPAPSSTPTPRSPTGPGRGSSRCRPATRRRSRAGGRSSRSPS